MILATANGYVKRTPLSAYRNARPGTGLRAMTLVEGDSLVSVSVTDGSGDLFVVSSAGRALRFPQSSVRVMGRTAKGVRSMRLPAGARVLNCTPITDESAKILVATENSYGKRVELSEFTPHGRGTMGQMLIRCSARNGAVAAAELVGETEDVIMLCNRGRMIRTRIAEIGVYGQARTACASSVWTTNCSSRCGSCRLRTTPKSSTSKLRSPKTRTRSQRTTSTISTRPKRSKTRPTTPKRPRTTRPNNRSTHWVLTRAASPQGTGRCRPFTK